MQSFLLLIIRDFYEMLQLERNQPWSGSKDLFHESIYVWFVALFWGERRQEKKTQNNPGAVLLTSKKKKKIWPSDL